MRVASAISILLLSLTATAQSYLVKDISKRKTKIRVSNDGSLRLNSNLKFEDQFTETCYGKVIKLSGDVAVVDIENCDNRAEIKKGDAFVSASGEAIPKKPKINEAPNHTMPEGAPTINESWYTLWSIGFTSTNYNDNELNDSLDDADESSDATRGQFAFDLLGFYWPLSDKKSMHGFVLHSISDVLIADSTNETVTIVQQTYSYSYHQFFGANIGDQWFWRGDIGLARFVLDIDTNLYNITESSDFGIGALIGGGYGFAIGTETRMLVGAYISHKEAEDAAATNISATMGFLF